MSLKQLGSDLTKLAETVTIWAAIVLGLAPSLGRPVSIAGVAVILAYVIIRVVSMQQKAGSGRADPQSLAASHSGSPAPHAVVQPAEPVTVANAPVGAPHLPGGWWQAHRDLILSATRRAMFWAFLGMGLGMGSYLAFLTMTRYPIIRPIYRYVVVPAIAIGLTGMVGAFIAGTTVFVGALVYSYQKSADTRVARITMFVLSGLVMAVGLALVSQGLPGNASTTRAMLARFVIGAGLLGSALIPLQGLTDWQRAAVAAVGGFAVFGLIRELEGIFFDMPILWQLAVGGGAAAGVTRGLNPSSWPIRWRRATASKAQSSAGPP